MSFNLQCILYLITLKEFQKWHCRRNVHTVSFHRHCGVSAEDESKWQDACVCGRVKEDVCWCLEYKGHRQHVLLWTISSISVSALGEKVKAWYTVPFRFPTLLLLSGCERAAKGRPFPGCPLTFTHHTPHSLFSIINTQPEQMAVRQNKEHAEEQGEMHACIWKMLNQRFSAFLDIHLDNGYIRLYIHYFGKHTLF